MRSSLIEKSMVDIITDDCVHIHFMYIDNVGIYEINNCTCVLCINIFFFPFFFVFNLIFFMQEPTISIEFDFLLSLKNDCCV